MVFNEIGLLIDTKEIWNNVFFKYTKLGPEITEECRNCITKSNKQTFYLNILSFI